MVLCVSDIIWPAGGSEQDTALAQTHPELEVTDGWYRLRDANRCPTHASGVEELGSNKNRSEICCKFGFYP